MTIREATLVHAAAEALYWLKQLQDDLRGHNESEQVAIKNLEDALKSYKKRGIHYLKV